jgi:hypothetical protein
VRHQQLGDHDRRQRDGPGFVFGDVEHFQPQEERAEHDAGPIRPESEEPRHVV